MTNTQMKTNTNTENSNIVVGVIVGVHGIKGLVKVKSFTEIPDTVFKHTLMNNKGMVVNVEKVGSSKGTFIAKFGDVNNRNVAETLKGTELFMNRVDLPILSNNEYYHSDLIDLKVAKSDGTDFGVVIAMHNFGAGDLIEVLLYSTNNSEVFHFENDIVSVDLQNGIVVIAPPVYTETEGGK